MTTYVVERLLEFETRPSRWDTLSVHLSLNEAKNKLAYVQEMLEVMRKSEANLLRRSSPNGRTVDYRLVERP